jgi:hypothetical protein
MTQFAEKKRRESLGFLQGPDQQFFLNEIGRNLIKDSRQYRFIIFASRFRISSKCIVGPAASLLPILQYQPRSRLRKTTGAKGPSGDVEVVHL